MCFVSPGRERPADAAMATHSETRPVKTTIHRAVRSPASARVALVLCLLYPCLAGGCPEFRNGAVDAIDAATRELLFGDATQQDAVVNAGQGVANAALDLLFDFLRAPSTR
jgi:hypothetical protein